MWLCLCVWVCLSLCFNMCLCGLPRTAVKKLSVSSKELHQVLIIAVVIEQTDHWTDILVQNHLCILLAL